MLLMPHKFNVARRHKFTKKQYRVTNWASYNVSLRQRGDLTIWITDEALEQWLAPIRTTRGGQPKYTNMATTICLTLGVVYKLPLRQTQGLMRCLVKLMGLEVSVPDFSTLSRRSRGISLPTKAQTSRDDPIRARPDQCLILTPPPPINRHILPPCQIGYIRYLERYHTRNRSGINLASRKNSN